VNVTFILVVPQYDAPTFCTAQAIFRLRGNELVMLKVSLPAVPFRLLRCL
jgi:hypothetical protein